MHPSGLVALRSPADPSTAAQDAAGKHSEAGGYQPFARLRRSLARISARQCMALLAAAALLAYGLRITNTWYHYADSAMYLMLGQNLAHGEGYTLWGQPHAFVPPGFPLMIAAQIRLGWDAMWCFNTTAAIMCLAIFALTYCVLLYVATRDMALLATAVFALSKTVHHESLRLNSDVPTMLCMLIGLCCYLPAQNGNRRWLEVGTLFFLAACGIRVPGVLIALGAALGLALLPADKRNWRVWANVALLGGAIAAGGLLAHVYVGASTDQVKSASYSVVVERLAHQPILDWLARLPRYFSETAVHLSSLFLAQTMPAWLSLLLWGLPIGIGIGGMCRRAAGIIPCVMLAYLVGMLIQRPLHTRYLLPVAPFLYLAYFQGLAWLVERLPRGKPRASQVAISVAVLLLCVNVPRICRSTYRLHFHDINTNLGYRDAALAGQAADFLRTHVGAGEKFVTNRDQYRLSFLSGAHSALATERQLIARPPKPRQIKAWRAANVAYLLNYDYGDETYQAKLASACSKQRCRLVYSNEVYDIYSLRAEEALPAKIPR